MKMTLEAWRRAGGMSQEAVAAICGVHPNTYRRWEANPGEIRLDKAILIADHLHIPLDSILLPSSTTECSKTEA
jgi:transcriptional regulator with XRE-family HTH domain